MIVIMELNTYGQTFFKSAFKFVHIHLFLTLFSLPILIWWGLPISIMALIGNCIFNSVLTLFLLISSLLFFSELLGIPNGLLVTLLEYVGSWWLWLLKYGSSSWLLSFAQPPVIVLCFVPLAALALVHYRLTHRPVRNLFCLFALLIGIYLICSFMHHPMNKIESIACGKQSLFYVADKGQKVLIDTGALASNASAPSWVLFTLTPLLIKKNGSTYIDTIIISKPKVRTFQALSAFLTSITIKTLVIPRYTGKLPKNMWRAYQDLKKQAHDHQCTLIILPSDKSYIVNKALNIVCHTKRSSNPAQIQFDQCNISTIIDNIPITFYDRSK